MSKVSHELKTELINLLSDSIDDRECDNVKYFEQILKTLGKYNNSGYIFDPGTIKRIDQQPEIIFGYVCDAWILAGRPHTPKDGTAFVVVNDCHFVEAVKELRGDDACVFTIRGPHCIPSKAFQNAFPDNCKEWAEEGSKRLQKSVAEKMGLSAL